MSGEFYGPRLGYPRAGQVDTGAAYRHDPAAAPPGEWRQQADWLIRELMEAVVEVTEDRLCCSLTRRRTCEILQARQQDVVDALRAHLDSVANPAEAPTRDQFAIFSAAVNREMQKGV